MKRSRVRRLAGLAALAALVAALLASANLAAPHEPSPPVEILGFRAGGSGLVAPGGTIERACQPKRLVVKVAVKNVRRGALVIRRWRVDGALTKGMRSAWNHDRRRHVVAYAIQNAETLPSGSYRFAIKVPGRRWVVGGVRLAC
jgi:hypothetical protein